MGRPPVAAAGGREGCPLDQLGEQVVLLRLDHDFHPVDLRVLLAGLRLPPLGVLARLDDGLVRAHYGRAPTLRRGRRSPL